jgi:hypothetical protein
MTIQENTFYREVASTIETLNIYNALGQSVSNHSLQLAYNQANSISLNELANGVYFAHINSNGKTQITKFVVSR